MRYAAPLLVAAAGLALSVPAKAEPAQPPLPGKYQLIESERQSGAEFHPYEVTFEDCGPGCLRFTDIGAQTSIYLHHTADPDGTLAWSGRGPDPDGAGCLDATGQYNGVRTGPYDVDYVFQEDLTGFMNVLFGPGRPDCSGSEQPITRHLRLMPALT